MDLSGSLLPPTPANRPSQIRCEGRFSGADSGQVRQGEGSAPAPCRSGRLTVLVVAVEDAGDLRADRS